MAWTSVAGVVAAEFDERIDDDPGAVESWGTIDRAASVRARWRIRAGHSGTQAHQRQRIAVRGREP